MNTAQQKEYRREIRSLDRAERAALKPLRDEIARVRRLIIGTQKQIVRQEKLTIKALVKLRARRAILEGRLS